MSAKAVQQWHYCPKFGLTLEAHGDSDCGLEHVPLTPEAAFISRAALGRSAIAEREIVALRERNFALSELATNARAQLEPLRALLGAVLAEVIPSHVNEPPERLHGIWRNVARARDGLDLE